MKRRVNIIYKALLTAAVCLVSTAAMNAQEYVNRSVEISKEKVRVDGKICYSHVILEKQTLYSIAKAYGVSIEEIYRFNPTLKETGLKKNSIILIPSQEALKTANTENRTDKVEPKSKEAADTVTSQSPLPAEESVIAVKGDDKKVKRTHIRKWYEDLDVIADHYGVSVESIMKANNLKGRKLEKRHKLIIPYPEDVVTGQETSTTADVTGETANPVVVLSDSTALADTTVAVVPKTKVDATLILPLTNQEGEPNRNNMDFYCGALLAVYDMAEKGIDCNLNVFDIMDNKSQFSVETIKESDFVIGPVSAADQTKLFYAVPGANAVVSPLDPRSERLTKDHPEMIQAPTPHSVLYKDLVQWIENDFRDGDRVVMIAEKGARQSVISSLMREALDSSSLTYNIFTYSILEGRDITESLTSLMSTEGANRILVSSESEAFVNDVVRNLNLLIYNNLEIVLYAPSKVRSFETIEVENFHNTSMHVSLGYYIDYGNQNVKDFLMKYRALFNTEPTQFAFQGYDIARYFIELSAKYGADWKEHLCDTPKEMLQSTFNFSRQGTGGYTNSGIRRIVYEKGYAIKIVQ